VGTPTSRSCAISLLKLLTSSRRSPGTKCGWESEGPEGNTDSEPEGIVWFCGLFNRNLSNLEGTWNGSTSVKECDGDDPRRLPLPVPEDGLPGTSYGRAITLSLIFALLHCLKRNTKAPSNASRRPTNPPTMPPAITTALLVPLREGDVELDEVLFEFIPVEKDPFSTSNENKPPVDGLLEPFMLPPDEGL